jgi:anti-sigma factor RsiW
MNEHIGDLAELYALGTLDELERARVDAHVARCNDCARLIGEAETMVTQMEAMAPQLDVPATLDARLTRSLYGRRSAAPWLAAAAALIVAVIPLSYLTMENRAMDVSMQNGTAMIARIAAEPHGSVAFAGDTDMRANVLYAKDGSWYCVVIRNVNHAVDVAWIHDGKREMIGTAQPHGDMAMLYLPKSHPMQQLALISSDRVVASAALPL